MNFSGQVVKKPFGGASKSARNAVMLVTDAGEFVLRRQGGNPFHDPALEDLIGKSIRGSGVVHGYTLIMSDWEEMAG